ncbi:hypothetical protein BV898_14393 [Hypsibius exemplaris]|uniref:RRM domain-containing protein n=1 Tax=Hypsibius exemplaris TaxID=2072580 RepID=A0A9X6NFJ9_HYPEX|nr:hypothetical protein BV898_14393 [Hypsibius exemplaris]
MTTDGVCEDVSTIENGCEDLLALAESSGILACAAKTVEKKGKMQAFMEEKISADLEQTDVGSSEIADVPPSLKGGRVIAGDSGRDRSYVARSKLAPQLVSLQMKKPVKCEKLVPLDRNTEFSLTQTANRGLVMVIWMMNHWTPQAELQGTWTLLAQINHRSSMHNIRGSRLIRLSPVHPVEQIQKPAWCREFDEEAVRHAVSILGTIRDIQFGVKPNRSLPFAFVIFASRSEAEDARNALNGT